ncbi:hypothetical protein AVANS_0620 [Campylobacter sp. RM5004]|uniref:autotransporter outer membrane beta-barrel domain-containing protein n=1 Tax=Campylobacter sp. RM5004 TaxID=1660078 RepID=UPI001EFB425D|nr:autotransporter outer membrane beta-barrel domain-containing protein [Campylobacter sp. RM5004]ULO01254.1 hypothetical protein AVANS_0620 [Campylobacter sp. RM5004]
MNKTIRLSLIAFMLLSANIINAETNLNNNIVTLADTIINVNSGTHNAAATDGNVKTIINHTGGTLNLNQNYSNMQITSTKDTTNIIGTTINNSVLDFNNKVIFDKINIFDNVSLQGNRNNSGFNYLLKDTSTTTFDNSSISDIKIEPWSEANEKGTLIIKNSTIHDSQLGLSKINPSNNTIQKAYIPNLTLNGVILDKTSDNKNSSIFSRNLNIANSSILDTDITIRTSANIDSSYIEGEKITLENNASISITNNSIVNSEIVFGANNSLTINNSSYEIKQDLNLANLTLINHTINGSADKKINISSNSSDMQLNNVTFNDINLSSGTYRIDLNGENTFNRLLVQNTNVKGSGHHITLGDKAQATFNDSEFINTAINNYSFKFNNTTIFNNSKFTNTSIGSASAASAAKVYINNSVINNTDAKATLGGGNIHITNSTINSDITGGNIFFDNLSTIQGTLRGGTIHVNNHNFNKTQKLVIKSGGIYSSGILDLDGIKNFEDSETNLEFGVDNNSTLNLTNMKIANTGMHSANVNEEELVNNSINISDSNLIEVGIGNRNNGGLSFVVDNLSLSNTDIKNTNKAIKAKNIKITGGNITATELRTINQILISPLYWHVNKIDTNIIIDNATINANVETGTLTLKNNSILNGDIQGTNKVIIDNATLNGNITRNDRGYCLIEEGCTGEIEDVSITNSTIKGNVNEVGNITLNNSSLESTSVIVKNDVKIDNSANIQGSFKVGNNLTLTNSAITGDIEEVKNLNLNDSSITTNKVVSASNDITITNTTKQTSSANFSAGNNFTSTNTEFSGNITTNNLLSDNNSTFKGEVVADSINAVGSTFDNTLTITGNSKNNILDNAKLNHGINVNNKDASLSIVNNSTILGSIVNNGIINVEEGSEVSKEVTGTGVLNTNSAFYEDKVEIGTIVGSNNTFKGDVTITNDEANFSVDTNHFHGDIIVSNGTLNASTNNDLNNIISNNINFKNEDVNTKDEINAKVVEVKDTLLIENIDVNTSQISAKQAQITNSNVTSKIFLKGNDDKATSVYDKAEITSGNYTINNSAIKGGIRVDSLSVNNSNIVGQLAVNKLNAINSTFYITGGGYNTSLYEHFSGAIIAKEGASGGNNTINISNTNIGKLINGYVPVAIINNKAPNAIRADMLAASPKIVKQEFFKVTYTTPISTIFLSPSVVHYNKIDDGTSIKEIWSVGLAGKELSESEVIDIINGKGNANYSTTQAVDKNYKDYIMSEVFDNATKKELNSIIYNPYFIAKNNLDILNDRYTYLRTDNKNHGFWLDNNYSYNFYNDIKLKNKGISVGVDNFIDLDKLSVSYGAFTNASRLSLDNAKIDTKLIGAYASTNFYNGVFIDYSLAYASLKHKFDAKKLEFNNTYYTNLWQASIKAGHRLGTTSYIEPSLEINATRFQKHNVKTKNVQITANQGTLVSLKTGVKAGVDLNKNFSLKTELAYYNDLNKSPKANVVSMLESDFSGIRDYGLNAKLGLLVKPSNKLDINADIAKKISLTNESNYKVNLGFNYKF